MGFNQNPFISPLFKLFGKKLAGVPPSPSNLDIIQFNGTSNEWELINGVIGNAVQSSSNVGTGAGLALPRVLDDLPFKTLVDGVEIVITVSATELTFSIGAIAISKITGLQVALDSKIETLTNVGGASEIALAKVGQNVNLRTLLANLEILITTNANDLAFSIGVIAQSKITGLVTALASKIETLTNVGTGAGTISKPKVGTNVDLKTIKAGTDISITNNADDIEISNIAVPPVIPTKGKFVMGYHADKNWKKAFTFGAMFTNKADEPVEAEAQGFFNFLYEVVEITVFVSTNIAVNGGNTITLKRNSVAIPATTITIPALTTGKFSLSVTEAFAVSDEIHEEHQINAGDSDNDIKNVSYYLECEAVLV